MIYKAKLKNARAFALVMEDERICREFLERLFPEKKISRMEFKGDVGSEVTIENSLGARGVRLDVLFSGEKEWFDIEMQSAMYTDLPKRTRFYASSMDMMELRKGKKFRELKTNYVIFICDFDYFGKDEPIYAFENRTENGLKLEDKSYKILLNTQCSIEKVPYELRSLYEIVSQGETENKDSLAEMINTKLEELSNDREAVTNMTLYDQMEDNLYVLEQIKKEKSELEKEKAEKESMIAELDTQLAAKDSKLAEKDSKLAEKDSKLAEKDTQLAEKDNELAEKDNELAEKDEIIRKLQEQLAQTK